MKSVKKSKVRIYLKPGGLKGYRIKDTVKSRRSILKKLLQKNSYSTIIKRLNVLSIYNKNRYPEISKKVKSDISFIQKNFYNLSKKSKEKSKRKSISKKYSPKLSKKRSSMKKQRSKKRSSMKKQRSKKRSMKKRLLKGGTLPSKDFVRGKYCARCGMRYLTNVEPIGSVRCRRMGCGMGYGMGYGRKSL